MTNQLQAKLMRLFVAMTALIERDDVVRLSQTTVDDCTTLHIRVAATDKAQ